MFVKDAVGDAIEANRAHQHELKAYAEKLQAELSVLDEVAHMAECIEDLDTDKSGQATISVRSASKPVSLVNLHHMREENSSFYVDTQRRQRYVKHTTIDAITAKEHASFIAAVKAEIFRMTALEAHRKHASHAYMGQKSHHTREDVSHELPDESMEVGKESLNWRRIAERMQCTSHTNLQRTPEELRVRWLGHSRPGINHEQWTSDERIRLANIVGSREESTVIDWVDVAVALDTGRTPLETMAQGVPRQGHTWNKESDRNLLISVQKYGLHDWSSVARSVSEDATSHQCQKRYLDNLVPSIQRGPWSLDEDNHLRAAVNALGASWHEVSQFVIGRTNNQCRERFQDRLLPGLKGKWVEEEDQRLLEAVGCSDRPSWKHVSQLVGNGRTDNMCRKRYENIQKQAKRQRKDPENS